MLLYEYTFWATLTTPALNSVLFHNLHLLFNTFSISLFLVSIQEFEGNLAWLFNWKRGSNLEDMMFWNVQEIRFVH